ncbi:MAG: hypothetical protein RR086_05870, partial [Clostridia bacterium]
LENERSGHLTKRLNRLSTWGFFKVLYRNDMFRMIGVNLLLLVFAAPMVIVYYIYMMKLSTLQLSLPYFNGIGLGVSSWGGVAEYFATQSAILNNEMMLWLLLASLGLAVLFAGGFGIMRDAFWTGRIKVFKPFWSGIKSGIAYTLAGVAVVVGGVYGIYSLFIFMKSATALWLAISVLVVLILAWVLVTIYVLILFSVVVTYKQSVAQNLADSWRLLWMNILPNILHFVIFLVPVLLYIFLPDMLRTFVITLMLFIGMYYFVHIWMSHMMKTFALFHPVLVNKKGETKTAPASNKQQA